MLADPMAMNIGHAVTFRWITLDFTLPVEFQTPISNFLFDIFTWLPNRYLIWREQNSTLDDQATLTTIPISFCLGSSSVNGIYIYLVAQDKTLFFDSFFLSPHSIYHHVLLVLFPKYIPNLSDSLHFHCQPSPSLHPPFQATAIISVIKSDFPLPQHW